MARPLDLRQAHISVAEHPNALFIPPEVWNYFKKEIQDLYVGTSTTLEGIREHMRQTHLFDATTKQWKEQLAKWGLKRYLNKADAAHILRLHHQARDCGLCRRVFFFSKEKTLLDIQLYIKKSTSVQGQPDLLREIIETDLPPSYITYEDIAQLPLPTVPLPTPSLDTPESGTRSPMGGGPTPPSPFALPDNTQTPLTSYLPSPSWEMLDPNGHPSNPTSLQEPFDSVLDDGFDIGGAADAIPTAFFPQETENYDQFQPMTLDETHFSPENALNLALPFLDPNPMQPSAANSPYFHGMMSATPVQRLIDTTTGQFDWGMPEVLRSILEDNKNCRQLSKSTHTASFFIHCIQACLLWNQDQTMDAENKFAAAAKSFNNVLLYERDHSLSVLSSLVALLESYGQRMAAREVLKRVCQVFSLAAEDMSPFTETVNFMHQTQLPDYGTSGKYDMETLNWIYVQFRRMHGPRSRLTLTAKYNVAWAELEHENYETARGLLIELKPLCESVFGPYHLQTIMAAATLARAHLLNKEYDSAQMIIEETVVVRVKKNFSDDHPYYYESKFRQAAFMKRRSDEETDPNTQQSLRQEAEALLRDVLVWRLTILGNANPRTICTFRVLKDLLVKEGKKEDADGLQNWAMITCQPRRQQLYDREFVLTWR